MILAGVRVLAHEWLPGVAASTLPLTSWSLFAQVAEPAADKSLDDASRAALLLAIIGILILGIGGALLIWLFGRMYKRWMSDSAPPLPSGGSHLRQDWHAEVDPSVEDK